MHELAILIIGNEKNSIQDNVNKKLRFLDLN